MKSLTLFPQVNKILVFVSAVTIFLLAETKLKIYLLWKQKLKIFLFAETKSILCQFRNSKTKYILMKHVLNEPPCKIMTGSQISKSTLTITFVVSHILILFSII